MNLLFVEIYEFDKNPISSNLIKAGFQYINVDQITKMTEQTSAFKEHTDIEPNSDTSINLTLSCGTVLTVRYSDVVNYLGLEYVKAPKIL